MLYNAYQTFSDLMDPLRMASRATRSALTSRALASPGFSRLASTALLRSFSAACGLMADTRLTHERPPYGFKTVMVGNREVEVVEEAADVTPFGTLLHFKKEVQTSQPRILLVAPLSGHFATLLRGTLATLIPENDVYVTDWHNARDVPLADGRFGFDEYVSHVIRFLEKIGPGAHVLAVCQPCVHALAAIALMAEAGNPATPHTMTLMAGPIDTRVNPTKVNELATSRPIEWFERNLIATVPGRYPGAGRRVYPGFVQLTAFMSMNMDRHVNAHIDLFAHLVRQELPKADAVRKFYDEYFAVLDLTAEFYLETVSNVFQQHLLAKGELTVDNRRVNPAAIRRTALLTVEGERDDICSVGQTLAAQELCKGIKPMRKRHHHQAGVGHYGVFSGSKWQKQIYPVVKHFILAND